MELTKVLNKTYTLRPHCLSCWTTYILQDDTRSVQCQVNFNVLCVVLWPDDDPSLG